MIKLFLINDELHVIQSLLDFDKDDGEIIVVGSSTSEKKNFDELKILNIDIVLINITIPEMDSIAYCRQLRKKLPKIKVIAFADSLNIRLLHKIWPVNADAIVTKSPEKIELVQVISGVMLGNRIIDNKISIIIDNNNAEAVVIPHLTGTEIDVLKLLGTGLRRKEVAHKMDRSYYTVEKHCNNLFEKFNIHKMKTILAIVRKAGIIK